MATPVDPGKQPLLGTTGERSIGQLVSDVSTDLTQIVRGEVELAKAEIKADLQHAGKGAGMFAGAGVFAAYGFGLLLLGLAGVIAIWLSWWAGLLIVAAVLFIVAAVLALIGKKAMSKVKGKPEKTIGNAQQTVEVLKQAPAQLKSPTPPPSQTARTSLPSGSTTTV